MRLHAALLAPIILLVASSPAPGQNTEGKRPLYSKPLQMPLRGDDFRLPLSIVADLNAAEVFVCDPLNHRIAIFDRNGLFKFEIRGGMSFRSPIDLAVNPEGYLFVLATHQGHQSVVRLDFDGRFLEAFELQGIPESSGGQNFRSIAISSQAERLYIADQWQHKLWITDLDGKVTGAFDFEEGRTEEEIENLLLGRVDVYGESVLMGVPSEGFVYRFDLAGNLEQKIGQKGATPCMLGMPVAAALDELDRVVILDQQRALFQVWQAEDNTCLHEYYGFGAQPGALNRPFDLALDLDGQVFITQGYEGRVQMYRGGEPAAFQGPSDGKDQVETPPQD